ncbi:MAG: arabinogalactan endo-1,4-beta-galactosidase [Muribaculaceae bacterium]|nr:arabinogalactan endo-1,4-beta-galactosidase [Muribaculaceae bacterium]
MKDRLLILLTAGWMMLLSGVTASADGGKRYVGGDISLLPAYEDAGAKYLDHNGRPIADLIPYLGKEGMNAMRVRVFVNPSDYTGKDADPNACQTVENVIPLCRRIKEAGMSLMLDFHYSDTWADPAHQYTPKQWASMTDEELYEEIYRYTRESLMKLRGEGIVPDFIQPGNEISYGMLWGPEGTPESEQKKTFLGSESNWNRLGNLLRNAIKGCREICPAAGIVLHTERTADVEVQDNFYDRMGKMGIDYDIIGLSYYPYFHGPLSSLENAINSLESKFKDKRIMVVETGYSYKWEVPGTSCPVDYPYSEDGQDRFVKDLVDMLLKHESVDGLFWWWLEYNAYGTTLSGWYNAPLFNSTNGKVLMALKTLCTFSGGAGAVDEIEADDKGDLDLYDLLGNKVTYPASGIYIREDGRKVMVRRGGR